MKSKAKKLGGPSRNLLLRDADAKILFLWSWPLDGIRWDKQNGYNCAMFRNESEHRSSDIILAAEKKVFEKWGPHRCYTYVDPAQIRSSNPGYCFKVIGWQFIKKSKSGKHLLEKTLTMKHSYTSTRDFSCKRRYYHQHIARDVERESTPAMEYGWLVHKGLEQRLAEGEPLPDNLAQFESFAAAIDSARARGLIVDVERRLGMRRNLSACDFHDPGCWWCGVLDVVIRRDSTALLYDWKTGKRREDPAELKIHAALLKAHHPELETIKGRYVWLRDETVGPVYDLSGFAQTRAEMERLDREIAHSLRTEYWPPQQNLLCSWCPCTRTQCEFRP